MLSRTCDHGLRAAWASTAWKLKAVEYQGLDEELSSVCFFIYKFKQKILNWNIGIFLPLYKVFYFSSKTFCFKKILGVKK